MIYFIYQVQSQEISEYGRSLFNIVDVKLFFFKENFYCYNWYSLILCLKIDELIILHIQIGIEILKWCWAMIHFQRMYTSIPYFDLFYACIMLIRLNVTMA